VVTKERKTRDQWIDTMKDMAAKGMNASDSDMLAALKLRYTLHSKELLESSKGANGTASRYSQSAAVCLVSSGGGRRRSFPKI
jgi:hypothetical protein